ncbi:MAG TPA: TIGR03960 family B12-binding radical SAM protein [Nitrospirota bacterium]|nr:TIGR03960 family B12-binding radical SAM protein [Nitrospirota bacterium]
MYTDILLSVSRPSRYIGHEINALKKDPALVRTRVALIFPDTYEIGMSHLGLKILYQVINSMDDVVAERAFVPWTDMEEALISKGLPMLSLESSIPLARFDILGFTLPYELCYTNVLTMLSLSGIPIHSSERDSSFPLIIGGGSAVFNPEPVADFFDLFFLGDGEEGITDIINTYNKWKESGGSRKSLLIELSKIEGVYVPSLYNVEYNDDLTIRSIVPSKGAADSVRRRLLEDLDKAPFPTAPVLPYMQAVHDRLTIEIARGCTHGCRFCQAGITYRPVRERSPEKILSIIEDSLNNTGYEEVSLSSLSTGDFACLGSTLTSLIKNYMDKRVSFSLPSLRVGTLTPVIIEQITKTKNAGFTIAPEAGTERLRKVINKEMDEGVLETTAKDVFSRGVKSIKMYFMVGLPTETDEDLQGIITLAQKVKDIGRRFGKGGKDITVSISAFVPKAHTPFQWYGHISPDELMRRLNYLRDGLKKVRINLKWHKPDMSYLESVFSRGDRRLGKVIETAWRSGCRFDSWTEKLDMDKWEEAFKVCGIVPDWYSSRPIKLDEVLPWEHLHTGVEKEFLLKEYRRAESGRTIPDCRYGLCPNCGLCDMEAVRGEKAEGIRPIALLPLGTEYNSVPEKGGSVPKKMDVRLKLRIKHTKTGDLRMLSQLEIMTTFERAFRRASVPILFSEGFHPHPKISFGPALPVGVESVCEYMDIELPFPMAPYEIKEKVNIHLPDGLKVINVKEIPVNTPSLNSFITHYAYEIRFNDMYSMKIPLNPPFSKGEIISPPLEKGGEGGFESGFPCEISLSDFPELTVERVTEKDGRKITKIINTRPFIDEISWLSKDTIFIMLKSIDRECCRPSDVLKALFNISHLNPGVMIRRVGLYGITGGLQVSPDGLSNKTENLCLLKS